MSQYKPTDEDRAVALARINDMYLITESWSGEEGVDVYELISPLMSTFEIAIQHKLGRYNNGKPSEFVDSVLWLRDVHSRHMTSPDAGSEIAETLKNLCVSAGLFTEAELISYRLRNKAKSIDDIAVLLAKRNEARAAVIGEVEEVEVEVKPEPPRLEKVVPKVRDAFATIMQSIRDLKAGQDVEIDMKPLADSILYSLGVLVNNTGISDGELVVKAVDKSGEGKKLPSYLHAALPDCFDDAKNVELTEDELLVVVKCMRNACVALGVLNETI